MSGQFLQVSFNANQVKRLCLEFSSFSFIPFNILSSEMSMSSMVFFGTFRDKKDIAKKLLMLCRTV